jgi:tetratricopeptide (TPR) repeat protein
MENEMNSQVVEKKKNKALPVIIAVAIVVVVGACIGGLVLFRSITKPQRELKKQLAIADKYLSEADYENAILAYEDALVIDPKNTEAFVGIISAYRKMGDDEMAIFSAVRALEVTGDQDFKAIADEMQTALDAKKANLDEPVEEPGEEESEEEPEEIDVVDFSLLEEINITDYTYEYSEGATDGNPDAVGMMGVDFAYQASQPVEIRIADWQEEPYKDVVIGDRAGFYQSIWTDTPWSVEASGSSGSSFPIWADDFGKQFHVLLLARDASGTIVGYAVIVVRV